MACSATSVTYSLIAVLPCEPAIDEIAGGREVRRPSTARRASMHRQLCLEFTEALTSRDQTRSLTRRQTGVKTSVDAVLPTPRNPGRSVHVTVSKSGCAGRAAR
jgi:hypothetical protein